MTADNTLRGTEKFWLLFWLIVGSTITALTWAAAWGINAHHSRNLDRGLIPTRVVTSVQYGTVWLPPDAAKPSHTNEAPVMSVPAPERVGP